MGGKIIKTNIDSAADEMWNKTMLNDGCIEYHDFREWLKKESD